MRNHPPPKKKMEKRGGLGGRGRSVGVIGSNVVIQRFNILVRFHPIFCCRVLGVDFLGADILFI